MRFTGNAITRCLSHSRMETVMRIALVTILLLILGSPGSAQPCNPVIDGTYCETQIKRNSNISKSPTSSNLGFGNAFSGLADSQPATLGTITLRGDGTRCMGLLRRGNCN